MLRPSTPFSARSSVSFSLPPFPAVAHHPRPQFAPRLHSLICLINRLRSFTPAIAHLFFSISPFISSPFTLLPPSSPFPFCFVVSSLSVYLLYTGYRDVAPVPSFGDLLAISRMKI